MTRSNLSAHRWVLGARPRTLPASVVPVLVGTAVAFSEHPVHWWRALGALVIALALQVGTNYANDYSDGIRGTDEQRVGPLRLVASGLASPSAVKAAAFIAFGLAGLVGVAIAAVAGWWLLAVGGCCIAAGWWYTAGKYPYGYKGLGEAFVFVFFGLVATLGSQYVQSRELTLSGLLLGCAVGLLAVALLVVNNLRDIPTDKDNGKLTLAVRIGDRRTRTLYITCLVVPFVLVLAVAVDSPFVALALLAIPFALYPARDILAGKSGRSLINVLRATARLQLVFGALVAIGIAL